MPYDPSVDVDTLIVAGVSVLLSAMAGISAFRSRREQTRLNREQSENQAFIRIERMYTTALATLEKQLSVANNRIAEQNKKIHDLELQINNLEHQLGELS